MRMNTPMSNRTTMHEDKVNPWRGLVLAGGRSSRMGTDKAFLQWRGRTLLEWAVERLEEVVGVGRVIVSGKGMGEHSVADQVAELGPLGGIATVSNGLPDNSRIMVVPVDMPLLQPDTLRVLRNTAAQGFLETTSRAYFFEDRELPFAFRLDGEVRSRLEKLCDPSVAPRLRSISAFLQALDAGAVLLPPQILGTFDNFNSREDWERLNGHEDSLQQR